jgi:hypothetical protein
LKSVEHGKFFTFSLFQFETFSIFIYMNYKKIINFIKIPTKFLKFLFI